ncbi:MAG TPA: SH3 domain-containing protein [Verrucomicrobiota bacterium]|nr:SH3 domain-containing protein [Verrucomicrobiota bacterium]
MKKSVFLLAVLIGINAFAQPAAPATSPAPKQPSKPAIVEPPVSLVPGPAVVNAKNVNVRAAAGINSEAIAQLNPGDSVTVIEQVNLDKFKPEEPRQWAKIVLPSSLSVWVHASFIDKTTLTVIPPKLNLRAGPGENHGVLGVIERGTTVREILTDGNWMRIAAPSSAHAFIAAMFLQQDIETPAVTMPTPAPAPAPIVETVTTPAEPTAVAATGTDEPESSEMMSMPAPTLQPTEPVVEPPPPPRVVAHEGIVTTTKSIQAPTQYQLMDPVTGKRINYLHTTSTNLNLSLYNGLRIVVTGEEALDARWKTPVITIRRIQVIE